MTKLNYLLLVSALISPLYAQADEQAIESASEIIHEITSVCQAEGMQQCRSRIQGGDVLFDYLALFDEVDALDAELKHFIETQYPEESGVDFDVIQASLKISMDIKFHPDQLTSKITDANKTDNGYSVSLNSGHKIGITSINDQWVMAFPAEMLGDTSRFETFSMIGRLKYRILTYRMLEAKMAGLSRDDLEANISEDLAPILVAVLSKEKVPTLIKWLSKDINEIVEFYNKVPTTEEMRAHISAKYQ